MSGSTGEPYESLRGKINSALKSGDRAALESACNEVAAANAMKGISGLQDSLSEIHNLDPEISKEIDTALTQASKDIDTQVEKFNTDKAWLKDTGFDDLEKNLNDNVAGTTNDALDRTLSNIDTKENAILEITGKLPKDLGDVRNNLSLARKSLSR